jgi:hypothetical protein
MIDAALNLRRLRGLDAGPADFYGTSIPQQRSYDIGAHEALSTEAHERTDKDEVEAHERTDKDEADFRSALPHFTSLAKGWLLHALNESLPKQPWTAKLRN